MDTTIYPLLDRIREEQLQQGTLLHDIAERQDESIRLLSNIGELLREPHSGKRLSLPKGTFTTGMQYLAVIAGAAYLLKGGDLEKLAAVAKVFGLL
jgi:hypothetical protein